MTSMFVNRYLRYDGQSQTESEHASLIDEHDSFNSVAKQIRFVF